MRVCTHSSQIQRDLEIILDDIFVRRLTTWRKHKRGEGQRGERQRGKRQRGKRGRGRGGEAEGGERGGEAEEEVVELGGGVVEGYEGEVGEGWKWTFHVQAFFPGVQLPPPLMLLQLLPLSLPQLVHTSDSNLALSPSTSWASSWVRRLLA